MDREHSAETEPINRGRPEWASSEEDWILSLLREAGAQGVSREHVIFTCRSTQCARAIHSLERRGFQIEHVKLKGEKFIRYILRQEPRTDKAAEPDLPLFAGVPRD